MSVAKPKPLKTARTEREVLAQVIEAARVLGIDLQRQNTGAGVNPAGKMVRFGQPGNSDLAGVLPDGRALHIEVKKEGFNPAKLRGKAAEHFARQLARLQKTNDSNGVAFWTDDAEQCLAWLRLALQGARFVESGDRIEIVMPGGTDL